MSVDKHEHNRPRIIKQKHIKQNWTLTATESVFRHQTIEKRQLRRMKWRQVISKRVKRENYFACDIVFECRSVLNR